MNKFYQLKQSNETNTDLFIHGDITSMRWDESDVGSYDFANDLMEVTTPSLTVHINSYGGEVSQGLAIYNLLKSFNGSVKTVCDGFACSAASVIFMAGTEREMPSASLLMIHNAWTYASGNAQSLRKQADDLEKITEPSILAYVEQTGQSREKIVELMDAESWLTADEALELGFATKIISNEVKQSTYDNLVHSLVMSNKRLEKELLSPKETAPIKVDAPKSFSEWLSAK